MSTETTETNATNGTKPEKAKRMWLAIKIVDYRLQALAPDDPDYPEGDAGWADIGADTIVLSDREAVFQMAREHGGLLMSLQGMPTTGRLTAMVAKAMKAPF